MQDFSQYSLEELQRLREQAIKALEARALEAQKKDDDGGFLGIKGAVSDVADTVIQGPKKTLEGLGWVSELIRKQPVTALTETGFGNPLKRYEKDAPKLGDPAEKSSAFLRENVPGAPGRVLAGAADALLDPMNLMGIGIAGRAGRGSRIVGELAGRGNMGSKAYLATLGGSGAGATIGNELTGDSTVGTLLGGLGGGWASLSGLSRVRRLKEAAMIKASQVNKISSNFEQQDVADALNKSQDRYQSFTTAEGKTVKMIDVDELGKQTAGRFASYEALKNRPGMEAQAQQVLDAAQALDATHKFMLDTNRSKLPIEDEVDFGRRVKGFYDAAANEGKLTLDTALREQLLGDIDAKFADMPLDFRYTEEGRGTLAKLFNRQLREGPGSLEGQIAAMRDVDAQKLDTENALKTQKQRVADAKKIRAGRQNEILGTLPEGAKSGFRNYVSALINGQDVEGAWENFANKARKAGLEPNREQFDQTADEMVQIHRGIGEEETLLRDLDIGRKEFERTYGKTRKGLDDQLQAEFGKVAKDIRDRLVQIPGQAGLYRPERMAIRNGKPIFVMEAVDPKKSVDDLIGENASVRFEEDEAYKAQLENSRQLKAQQAELRRAGDTEGASAMVDAIRESDAQALRLKEPARPLSGKDLPKRAPGKLLVDLDDAREFVVLKPGKKATPSVFAKMGMKDPRTLKMVMDESRLRMRHADISSRLEKAQEQIDSVSQGLDSRDISLIDAGMLDTIAPEKIQARERLRVLQENVSRAETELSLVEADQAVIQNSISSSQQALEATRAAAAQEAAQSRLLLEQARADKQAALAKIEETLALTPEDAGFQSLQKHTDKIQWKLDQVTGRTSKRMTQSQYEAELEDLDWLAQKQRSTLPKPAQDAIGAVHGAVERRLNNLGEQGAIRRLAISLNDMVKLVDPDAHRNGPFGWGRRVLLGTGARTAAAEGHMAAKFNIDQRAASMAELDHGGVKRDAIRFADIALAKMGDYVDKSIVVHHGTTKGRAAKIRAEGLNEGSGLTPQKEHSQTFADFATRDAIAAGELDATPEIMQFRVNPDEMKFYDVPSHRLGKNVTEVYAPGKLKYDPDVAAKSSQAAWARSVQAIKDPAQRLQAVLKNAAKPIQDRQWQKVLKDVPEGAGRQEVYDMMVDHFETMTLNPQLFDFNKLDRNFFEVAKRYGQGVKELRKISQTKGIVRNLLKSEYRQYAPDGRIPNEDGSVTVLKNDERNVATDLYEIRRKADLDETRREKARVTGKDIPPPTLEQMLAPKETWDTVTAGNMLSKFGNDQLWQKIASEQLKDPKAVELLKRGQDIAPSEWKDPEYAQDWPKLKGLMLNEPPKGMWKNVDVAAKAVQRMAASTIVGDGSFATVQGLMGLAINPIRGAHMLKEYWKYAKTDEGFAAWMADARNAYDVEDLVNRGLGVGRASITGIENTENLFQSIPGLKRVGNVMAGVDKITFDRMQLMNKVNAVRTMEADLQLMRAFDPGGTGISKEFVDGIPSLKALHESVDIWQSTPDQIRNAIVRQVNNQLGGLSKSQSLLGRDRQAAESLLLFVPGFFRARGGLINSVSKILKNPDSPEGYLAASILGREMIFRLGTAAMIAEATGTTDQFQKDVDSWRALDPRRSGGMLSGPLGDGGYLGLSWGNQAPKLYAQLLLGNDQGDLNFNPMDRLESMKNFFAGRQNPVLGTLVEQIKGEDFLGRPIESPRDRLAHALGAITPMFMANIAQEGNEMAHTGDVNPLAFTAQSAGEFFGLNVRNDVPFEVLNNRFTAWQEEQYPGQTPLKWNDPATPSAFKELARADGGIKEAEQRWINDMTRRNDDSRASRDVVYKSFEDKNAAFDQRLAKSSAELDAGRMTAEQFRQEVSTINEDRADAASFMQEILAKMGVDTGPDPMPIAGHAPELARLMAEYNAVKPQKFTKQRPTEGGLVLDTDIDWGAFKTERDRVLAAYPPSVREQFEATRVPEDPNLQRLQAARSTLDTYFDELPKYKGLSNTEGKTLDAYKSVLFAQEQSFRDQGIKAPREQIMQAVLRQMEQSGQISNPRQAQLAVLALRMSLNSEAALRMRNPGAIEYLLRNAEVFQWYPWLESELPSKLTPLIPQTARDTNEIMERELRGTQLASIR